MATNVEKGHDENALPILALYEKIPPAVFCDKVPVMQGFMPYLILVFAVE